MVELITEALAFARLRMPPPLLPTASLPLSVHDWTVSAPALRTPPPPAAPALPFPMVNPDNVTVPAATLKMRKAGVPLAVLRRTVIFCPPPSIVRLLPMTNSAVASVMLKVDVAAS